VFALAISLLILNLQLPDVPKPITPLNLTTALLTKWPNFLIFVISFATVFIMWVYHHNLFKSARRPDTPLLFTNGLLLLLVVIVPFPTSLVAAYLTTPAASVACAVYAGFFVLIDSAYCLVWLAVSHQQSQERSRKKQFSLSMIFSFLGIPCYVVAALVAFLSPIVTLVICGLLWIVWAVTLPKPEAALENNS